VNFEFKNTTEYNNSKQSRLGLTFECNDLLLFSNLNHNKILTTHYQVIHTYRHSHYPQLAARFFIIIIIIIVYFLSKNIISSK